MKLYEDLRRDPIKIVLIQWYDFISEVNPYLYGCSHLKLTDIYNIVDIETIKDIAHIIPYFNKKNEYFINKFIF